MHSNSDPLDWSIDYICDWIIYKEGYIDTKKIENAFEPFKSSSHHEDVPKGPVQVDPELGSLLTQKMWHRWEDDAFYQVGRRCSPEGYFAVDIGVKEPRIVYGDIENWVNGIWHEASGISEEEESISFLKSEERILLSIFPYTPKLKKTVTETTEPKTESLKHHSLLVRSTLMSVDRKEGSTSTLSTILPPAIPIEHLPEEVSAVIRKDISNSPPDNVHFACFPNLSSVDPEAANYTLQELLVAWYYAGYFQSLAERELIRRSEKISLDEEKMRNSSTQDSHDEVK